jgi:hypothetical protein
MQISIETNKIMICCVKLATKVCKKDIKRSKSVFRLMCLLHTLVANFTQQISC